MKHLLFFLSHETHMLQRNAKKGKVNKKEVKNELDSVWLGQENQKDKYT